MSAILLLLSLMPRMVSTTWLTTSPPCTATVEALCANWLAWRALSAFCLTVEESSSMLAAVSSRALAWLSVRALRSWLPWAIWLLAAATDSEPERTVATTLARLSRMVRRLASRLSGLPSATCTSTARLPCEISLAMLEA